MLQARLILTLALSALVSVYAQDINDNDIPNQCRHTCDPVQRLSDGCRRNNNGNMDFSNPAFAECVCNSPTSRQDIVTCNECVNQNLNWYNSGNGNRQNYVRQWAQSCGYGDDGIAGGAGGAYGGGAYGAGGGYSGGYGEGGYGQIGYGSNEIGYGGGYGSRGYGGGYAAGGYGGYGGNGRVGSGYDYNNGGYGGGGRYGGGGGAVGYYTGAAASVAVPVAFFGAGTAFLIAAMVL